MATHSSILSWKTPWPEEPEIYLKKIYLKKPNLYYFHIIHTHSCFGKNRYQEQVSRIKTKIVKSLRTQFDHVISFFLYFWQCWVFFAVVRPSWWWLFWLWSMGSRACGLQSLWLQSTGSLVAAHRCSCSAARGILLDQEPNLRLLHWQVDSLPLSHQGSLHIQFQIFGQCIYPGISQRYCEFGSRPW